MTGNGVAAILPRALLAAILASGCGEGVIEPSAPSSPVPAATLTAEQVVAAAAVDSTADTDRAVLVVFYNTTDGPNWRDATNWLTDKPGGSTRPARVGPALSGRCRRG